MVASNVPPTNATPLNSTITNGNGSKHDDQFQLGNFCVDQPRPMKVAAIGAGYSGIMAGIRFRQKVQNLNLTIYESNAGIGGTWLVNKYPGAACDAPSHTYQLLYEEKEDWSGFYSPGPEILGYLEGVVDKYKLRPYIKLQHRVVRAEYSEPEGKWHLTIRKRRVPPTDKNEKWNWDTDFEEFEDVVDVVFAGIGCLSRWSWPDIKGLETFKGNLIHSADWDTGEGAGGGWEDTVKSWGDKNVAVVGVGSTALQIVPALQPKVKHLVNYVRGKTWVTSSILKEQLIKLLGGDIPVNCLFTKENREAFKDPEYYQKFRREIESELNAGHPLTIRDSPMQVEARAEFHADMIKRLEKKPWIADHLIPNFSVCCRRITPGPGYLEALCEDNADFVPTLIQEVTPTGIMTTDGKLREFDVIVCATGFDTDYKPPFPVVGRNGVLLSDKYEPHAQAYLSVAVDGFPNWFQSLGPNGGLGAGAFLLPMECQVNYAVAATLKLQRERLKSMEVKKEAVDDFNEYVEHYFKTTVFSEKCRSWYKAGKEEGRVVALWPGSVLHSIHALAHPRWEDFNYEPMSGVRNRFHWLGDGDSLADKDPLSDKAWYLDTVDFPPIPKA